MQASGQIQVGANASLTGFSAKLDLIDSSQSSVTRFTPVFTNSFSASGQITASATFGLPVSLAVGIDVIALGPKGRKVIALTNEPSLKAEVTFGATTGGASCGVGAGLSLTFAAPTRLDFFGLKQVPLANPTIPPLAAGCRALSPAGKHAAHENMLLARQGEDLDNSTGNGIPLINPNDLVPANDTDDTATYNLLAAAFNASEDAAALSPNASLLGTTSDTNSDGSSFTTIPDLFSNYLLEADESGNFRLVNYTANPAATIAAGLQFEVYNDTIVADDASRLLHYYPDLMAKYGVSRFRISDINDVPKTSDLVGLVPFNYDNNDNTPGVLMALDTNGTYFYPVACNLEGESAKLFLVNDPVAGAQKLEDPALRFTVTGGVTSDCAFLPLLGPFSGF